MRLYICMPTYGQVCAETMLSIGWLMFELGHHPPEGLEWVGFEYQSSSNLPRIRHDLAVSAMKQHEATHILWIDADMAFPRDSFTRLLSHDVEVVGVNYPRRLGSHHSTATDLHDRPLNPQQRGLQRVSVIGFGLLLTRISVFEDQFDMPLFAHHDADGYCSEDVTFCRKVRANGHDIWVDHDLSREVRHVSSHALTYEDMLDVHLSNEEKKRAEAREAPFKDRNAESLVEVAS